MAEKKADAREPTTETSEHVAESRRGSFLFADESKRKASIAQLTANTTGE